MSFLPFEALGIRCVEKMRLNELVVHALVLENLIQNEDKNYCFMCNKVDKEFWYTCCII